MQAKNIFYQPNGTGRDRYIFSDSGGFKKMNKIYNQNLTSGKEPKIFEGIRAKKKRVTYSPDGSGRDGYAEDGQILLGDYKKSRCNFLKSLRNYGSFSPTPRIDNVYKQKELSVLALKTRKFIYQERDIRDFNPQYKVLDDNNSPKYQRRKVIYKEIINSFERLKENTQKSINEQTNQQQNKENLSTIRVAQYPFIDKNILSSPFKMNKQNNSHNIIQQNQSYANKVIEIQKMLNNRKII